MFVYQNNVQDKNGKAIVGATVTIRVAATPVGTGALASLFSNSAGTLAIANPVFTDANGMFSCAATDGFYDIIVTGTGVQTQTIAAVRFEDYSTVSSSQLAASSGSSLVGFMQSGTGAVARTMQSKQRDFISVRDFGAVGDGITDDTAALTAAINTGSPLYFPVGQYIISAALPFPVALNILGVSGETYQNYALDVGIQNPSYKGTCSIIQYAQGIHGSIFSGFGNGAVVDGIVFRVGQNNTIADSVHTNPNLYTWRRCKFEGFSTVFKQTGGTAWGAAILHNNRFFANGAVFDATMALVDTVATGNIFTSNGSCFNFQSGGGFCTITGNRFEFNGTAITAFQSRASIVSGNVFDSNSSTAIDLINSNGWAITGNKFNGNGWTNAGAGTRSHLHIKGSSSFITIAGNEFNATRSDTGINVTPYILELESMTGIGNRFVGNSDSAGWLTAPIFDTFSNSANAFTYDSFTIPATIGNANTATDTFITILAGIQSSSARVCDVFISAARQIIAFASNQTKIVLRGIGTSAIAVTNGAGAIGFHGMDNIAYGGLTYTMLNGQQYATAQPNTFRTQGTWLVGQTIFNTAPVAGSSIGWVVIANGSPDTWRTFGPVGQIVYTRTAPAYGASVAIDASLGNEYDITVTNGTAFTVANPTNPTNGQRITITIRNTFGVIGAVTWDTLYKLSAWTQPANGFSRSIDFRYDGTNWVQVSQTGVDVPN